MRSENKLLITAWLAVVAACFFPIDTLESVSLCLFRGLTGIPCPGCGMGHAIYEFFAGDWLASAAYHPLGPIVAITWTLYILGLSFQSLLYNPAHARNSNAPGFNIAHGNGSGTGPGASSQRRSLN